MSAPPTGSGEGGAGGPTGNTYDKYATRHPVERRLVAGFFAALDAVLPQAPPRRVLEVGVGEGAVTARLRRRWPGAELVGLDLPDAELAGHWDGAAFRALFASVEALPFPDDSFDLVLAVEVLEHVDRPEVAVGELARVASGTVVASVPREPIWRMANLARGRYARDLGNTPGHVNHWSRGAFRSLLDRHVEVSAVRSPFPWTVAVGRARPARPIAS